MNHEGNEFTLELIDQATAATKRAAHACGNSLAKEHLEYALALIAESWIDSAAPPRPAGSLWLSVSLRSAAASGQEARKPQAVVADVASSLRLFELVCSGKEGN